METKMIEKDIATDLANAYNEGFYAGEKDMEAHYETIVLPKVRKETAREILERLYKKFVSYACAGDYYTESDIEREIQEIAKRFGVEVEE